MGTEVPRWFSAALLVAGSLFWSEPHAQFPGDFVYRGDTPEQALPLLRDAAIGALRELPYMERGYPKAAAIREMPIPGRTGEMRLYFDPSDDPGVNTRGILLDSAGSALQLRQGVMTSRARLITVYLPRRDEALAAQTDYFRVQQVEFDLPYLAAESRLDVIGLGQAIAHGLRQAGALPIDRPSAATESDP